MKDNHEVLEKNKETLLANLLLRNQELEREIKSLQETFDRKEKQCSQELKHLEHLKKDLKTNVIKSQDFSKQLMLKEKMLDVRNIEISKLNKKIEEMSAEINSQKKHYCEVDEKIEKERKQTVLLQQKNDKLIAQIEHQQEAVQEADFELRRALFALEGGQQGIWDFDLLTNRFEFSEGWCQLFGYHEPLHKDFDSFLKIIHPDDRKVFKKNFERMRLTQSGSMQQCLRIQKRDQSYLLVENACTFFRDPSDNLKLSGYSVVAGNDEQEIRKEIEKQIELAIQDRDLQMKTLREKLSKSNNNEQLKTELAQALEKIKLLEQDKKSNERELEQFFEEYDLLTEKLISQEEKIEQLEIPKKDISPQNEKKKNKLVKHLKKEVKHLKGRLNNLSLIADKTDNAIIITDKHGHIEYVNQGFEALTEYTFAEVKGKKPGSFLQGAETDPEHVKAIREGLNRKEPFSQDILNYSKSGVKYWLSISITPIIGEKGEIERFIAVERDVTEVKERDAELRDAEEELRKIMEDQFAQSEQLLQKEKLLSEALAESEQAREEIENLSMVASKTDNAVIITNAQGNILYVNEGFERITEYTKEEVLGKKPGNLLQGPDTDQEHVEAIRRGLKSKRAFKQDILNYSKSGKPYWLNISINPILNEHGEVEKFIAIENEITAQKRQEEEYKNLSLVASRTDNAVIISDKYGKIEWVNDGFIRLTEYSLEEVKGKKPGSFLQGPDTSIEDVRKISQGIKSMKPFKQEIYNYSKSGRGYWLSISITPIFDNNGQIDKFIAIETDITQEKASQEEMQKLSLVASRTDNAVVITDKYGMIEWVNDGFTRLTEYHLDEVKGKKPGSFLQGEKTSQEDIVAIRRGINSKRPFKHEIYNYSKSGRGYWLSVSITPIFDENGEVDQFIAIETDITKQKETELELENLSLVASKTDNAVIITDHDGKIQWANDGFVKLTEYSLEEVKGKKPGSFLQGEETREEDVLAIRRGLKSERPFMAEIYNYSKSGRGYWLSISMTPIFDEFGTVEKFIAIERDITEEKKLNAEIQESEEQMRLLMEDQFTNQELLLTREKELEKTLEESKILSLVASKTDNAVIITSKEGLIQYVNKGFEKISGYTFEEVKGMKPGAVLQGPDTNPQDIEAIRNGLKSGKAFEQEILNYSKNGKPYWLALSITPIFDESGEIEQFIAIERDISERKAAEEELQNLSLVASKTDNAVIITDQKGHIEWVNEGFEKTTEYTFDEVIGKKPGDILQGEKTTPEQVAAIRRGLKSGQPFSSEIYNYSKSGRGYWLAISITPIYDKNGTIEKFIAIESDITARKTLELEIQDSEEQMREIMDQQFADSESLMKKEEALNKALEEEKERKKELDEALARLKETQTQIVQSEKMASLGQLTAGIAHEINNPINFVYNGIDSLDMSIEDLTQIMKKYNELSNADEDVIPEILAEIEDMKKRLRYDKLMRNLPSVLSDIKNGANRTIEIVKGLRVFSRLDEEEQKPANINECIDSTLILLRNKTKDRIKVDKFFDKSLKDIMCYPGQLNQVFMNLLSNAVQAIPEEKKDGKVMIYTENLEKSVVIRILDNGSGIPEGVKKKIFEPFFTTKPVGIGTGLGLSISYGIIEKHDGQIYVNSEVDKGTEFVIELPKESKKVVKVS